MSWTKIDRFGHAAIVMSVLLFASVSYASTPPRLVELECPICHTKHWEIDADFRGEALIGLRPTTYEERTYKCYKCRYEGSGYHVTQKAPVEFLLQPDPTGPMTQADFDYWVGILRENFPNDRHLKELGTDFRPNTVFPANPEKGVQ